ncbi:MAG TPA: CHAP domain-containing protein [Chloroflexota bacterium]|nr:CHAP domain-containing protein [Chloroflexota bacterium]
MRTHLAHIFTGVILVLTLLGPLPVAASARSVSPPSRQQFTYLGASGPIVSGRPTRIPSYTLAFPLGWTAQPWPDTLAGYGQVALRAPGGGAIDLVILPLRRHGPTLANLIKHDRAYFPNAIQDAISLPPGRAIRLSGTRGGSGVANQILYLERHGVVYRFFSDQPLGPAQDTVLAPLAAGLHVPAVPGARPGVFPPPPVSPASGSTCCHCPALGQSWGKVLTHVDGIPVFSNAGDIDNGCNGTTGTLYQCVELVQRYYTLRWGYPAIWGGVGGAADMPTHHPAGITFIPNGGSPGPREGDAVVFYGGYFGHVALVRHIDRSKGIIDLVEENWSPTGTASLTIFPDNTIAIRDSAYGSYTVAGWLHSTLNHPTSPKD